MSTVTPRDPARRLTLGGERMVFASVGGPPNVHDCERGRRPGNFADYCDILRLIQSLEVVHCIGNQPCAPTDLPAESRHLDCYLANLTLTDKAFLSTSIGAERVLRRSRDGGHCARRKPGRNWPSGRVSCPTSTSTRRAGSMAPWRRG